MPRLVEEEGGGGVGGGNGWAFWGGGFECTQAVS